MPSSHRIAPCLWFDHQPEEAGGDERAQACGWLKDRVGVCWQIVPRGLAELVSDPGSENSQRAMAALLQMKKIDIARIERAYAG